MPETGGTLVVLGTPAEEGGGGKILMAQQGAFEEVDAAMMVHPAGMDLAAMHVLAFSLVEVEYRGRAAHASAFPHRGINALDALVTAYNAIAQLRQHIRATERIHGIITDGGQAPNVVPERAAGVFCIRAATAPQLARLKERVLACFHAGAQATGAAAEPADRRGRLLRPVDERAACRRVRRQPGATRQNTRGYCRCAAVDCGQHRYGQREQARARHSSDDRRRARRQCRCIRRTSPATPGRRKAIALSLTAPRRWP